MEKIELSIPGVWVAELHPFDDCRGRFTKLITPDIEFDIKETYTAYTRQGAIRGMHFQAPPYIQNKLVYCISGLISDVVIDLRADSETYGQTCSLYLDDVMHYLVHIPAGCAHGYYAWENSHVMYFMDEVFHPECYGGIHWKSCVTPWPDNGIVSEKDAALPYIYDFSTPFI